jgi:hypothetical protein
MIKIRTILAALSFCICCAKVVEATVGCQTGPMKELIIEPSAGAHEATFAGTARFALNTSPTYYAYIAEVNGNFTSLYATLLSAATTGQSIQVCTYAGAEKAGYDRATRISIVFP